MANPIKPDLAWATSRAGWSMVHQEERAIFAQLVVALAVAVVAWVARPVARGGT